jgi:hypothetical protein
LDGLTDALAPGGKGPAMFGVHSICQTPRDCRSLPLEKRVESLFRE